VHPSLLSPARQLFGALVCAAAFVVAGCHHNTINSGYGIGWVTLTGEPGGTSDSAAVPADFLAYQVIVNSVQLTRSDGAIVTAVSTPTELVDLTKLKDISELWSSSASLAVGSYKAATITLDYTNAVIVVLVNGVPTKATVVGSTGKALAAISETISFDPAHPFVITATYASTSAERIAFNFDMAASGWVNMGAATPVVTAVPYLTVSVLPSDTHLTRIRGPLYNSSAAIGTYTVQVRPFFDEVDNLGALTLFGTSSTIYSINGKVYTGNTGVSALSVLSAGTTMTAAYTTFTPDVNTGNGAPAGTFSPVYVVGGSLLEDNYTEGLSGDVVARSGNTLTLRNSTLFVNTALTTTYETADKQVLVGPGTLVTADDSTQTGLTAADIAVGQHIEVRGVPPSSGSALLDATTTSATNTGSVRLQSSKLYGTLASLGSGALTMNLQYINDLPASSFNFAGNGATPAQDPSAAAFAVGTGTVTAPADAAVAAPLWVDGLFTPFGSAPPAFAASAVNSESTVQLAGRGTTGAGSESCGAGSQICEPAQLRILYSYTAGTTAPFVSLQNSGFSIDLANASLVSAVLRIGKELVDLKSLPASPQVVPTSLPVTSTFSPLFSVGNPGTATSTTTPAVTTATTSIQTFSTFASFVTAYDAAVSASSPVRQITARGVYNRASNTFTATTVNVVL
jgi:hypothetical protein